MAIAARPRPRQIRSGPVGWLKENLFDGWGNSVLSVLVGSLLLFIVYVAVRFLFVDGEWDVIASNRRLLFLGRYPADAIWRVWPPSLWLAFAGGLSYGIWSRLSIRELVFLGLIVAFLLAFIARGEATFLVLLATVIGGASYVVGRRLRDTDRASRAGQVAIVAWAAFLPLGWLLLFSFGAPSSSQIGGFLLNVVLAAVALTASLPVGIALALGRASRFQTLRYGCVSIIEFVRAGPLLVWIFMAQFVLPDFLPGFLGDVDLIIRVIIVLTIFTSAYIAEIVRGGLQSVPKGQVEAAEAVGLGTFTITFWIVLPQALRAVIPAMVSQLISLWKDTSLVAIIGAFDLLRVSQATQSQPEFRGTPHEVLLFAALMFWIVAFTMSRLSRRLEGTLGVGTR